MNPEEMIQEIALDDAPVQVAILDLSLVVVKCVKVLNFKCFDVIIDLRRRNRELEEIIEKLKSRPGGDHYLEAEKDFEESRNDMI